ncbi:MAG: leucine-rich repeat domain-containing protein [Verrucomicrobiia bacterium]
MKTRRISRPRICLGSTLILLLMVAFAVVAQEQFQYTTNSGTITITGGCPNDPDGVVTIPETIKGLPVSSIGDGAFFACTSLVSLTIPHSVTSIEESAFVNCTSLTSVTLGEGVTNVGPHAFRGCTNLTSITIPNSVTCIERYAFLGCTSLTNATVSSSVTTIESAAFRGCSSLSSITVPKNVINLGIGAFDDCASLMAITVDVLNPAYSSLDGILFDKLQTALIKYPGGKAGSYTIPNTVTNLTGYSGKFADSSPFSGCTGLTSLTIPSSVTNIGWLAVWQCTSLTNVTIPSSVISIDHFALYSCSSLMAIEVDSLNPYYSSLDGILFDKLQTELIDFPEGRGGGYTIPKSVTSIGGRAFLYCTNLTSVTIGESVTNIGGGAFEGCTSLTSVTIGKSVTTIGMDTFHTCSGLTSVTIPGSVTSIGNGAFNWCISLRSAYFEGQPPSLEAGGVFDPQFLPTIYYLPGTTGWGSRLGGCPTALWLPEVQTADPTFGVQTNGFGFTISWASYRVVVVEAADDLSKPTWTPVSTNILTGGTSYFSDSQSVTQPSRFYRVRVQ